MPRKDNFLITPEQAEQFYMEDNKHTDKVMKHLLERSGGKPTARKKILPINKCCEIAEIALLHSDEETPQKLHNLIQQYIKSDTVLREYAALSIENFEKVQFAVYRIALERYAEKLTRDILNLCAEYSINQYQIIQFNKCGNNGFANIQKPGHQNKWQIKL